MMKVIHIDIDQFFAAVEQRDNPELKGKPIAVGHDAEREQTRQNAKFLDFQQITRSITVDHILRTKDEILPLAKQLMQGVEFFDKQSGFAERHSHPIRLLGLGVSNQKNTTAQEQQPWVELELEFEPWPEA